MVITYCNVNFPEEGLPNALRVSRQPLDQWNMIFQLQDTPSRRVELDERYEWLLLGDMLLKLANPETQRILARAIRTAKHVVINDFVHAEEGQHNWLETGLPGWMPRRDYTFVTNAQTPFRSKSWLRVNHYDFLFNRTKAYYAGFPFHGSPWYYAGRDNYRAPPVPEDPDAKRRIFISPCRLYLDYQRTYYRKRLFELTAAYAARGYRSGPGRVRNGVLDKAPTGSYLASTTDDPLLNFARMGWAYDPRTKKARVDLRSLKKWAGSRWQGYSPIHNRYYDDTFISIYAETLEYGTSVVITEKTYEPLIKGHFILPFSTQGFIAALKKLGFEVPAFIDYTYDDIKDDERRFRAYGKEVRRLIQMPLGKWRALWRRHVALLSHNQRLFHLRDYHKLPLFE